MPRIALDDDEHAAVAKALRKPMDEEDRFPLSPRLRPFEISPRREFPVQ
jgi:hypothetical protein